MFWYNVISHNSSYYFKMYISEIKKKHTHKVIVFRYLKGDQVEKTEVFCVSSGKTGNNVWKGHRAQYKEEISNNQLICK